MAKNKTRKNKKSETPGRMPLTAKLRHRLYYKDAQISALLRGRDVRDRDLLIATQTNKQLLCIIELLVKKSGIMSFRIDELEDVTGDNVAIFETGEEGSSRTVYIGLLNDLKKKFEADLNTEPGQPQIIDATDAMKVEESSEPYDGDDVTEADIDDDGIRQTYDDCKAAYVG